MSGYESHCVRCKRPDYATQYIDYGLHKEKLHQFYARRRQLSQIIRDGHGLTAAAFSELTGGNIDISEGLMDDSGCSSYFCYDAGDGENNIALVDEEDAILRMSIMERREFTALLEDEISKSAIYYNSTLLPNVQRLVEDGDFNEAANQLLEAIAFACTNIITFRQLLIRYDAFCRTFDGMPLTEWFLQRSVLDVDHPVHGFFSLEGVDDLEKRIVIGMHLEKYNNKDGGVLVQKEDGSGGGEGKKKVLTSAEEFTVQVQSFIYLLEKTGNSLNKAVAGHLVFKDRFLAWGIRLGRYVLFANQSRGLIDEPKSISMRGRHFKKEIKVIAKWTKTNNFDHFSIQEDQKVTFKEKLKEVKPENAFPLFLNMVSCFLYMMNNYIIEPSSAYYAEALGTSDALSGLMVGASPWFALMSCIGYSYWTNNNYKMPILCSSILQIVGNFMYANAYGHQSIMLSLLGRAIQGLGAPRIINRRYVADATPFSLRTAASAAFAMSTALGAAMGPGMAILLDKTKEFEFYLPLFGEQYFNGMTGPGYFMALNWIIYTLCIIRYFNEPTRSGLDELKRREEKSGAETSKEDPLLGRTCSNVIELAAISDDRTTVDATPTRELSLDDVVGEDDEGTSSSDDTDNGMASLDFDEISPNDSPEPTKGYSYYCYCIKNMTKPIIVCMSLIFMKRIALESIVGSTSIITKNRYGWDIKSVGTLHLVNGIIVIPVSVFSGYLSTVYEDRYMAIWFLAITLFGMAFLFDPTDLINHEDTETYNDDKPMSVGPARYILGSLIAFSAIEACESYVASLMSKVVPSALAVGTFNAGLLATLVGTGGRATGDLFITLMGLISIRNLLNLLIVPGATLVATSIIVILWNYELLAV